MTFWTAVVIIVALGCLAEVLKTMYRAKHGITTDMMGNEKPLERENRELTREVEDLRERLHVLERIATEDRETKLLSAKIESLRDKSPAGEGR